MNFRLLIWIIVFIFLVNIVFAADGKNISFQTGATSSGVSAVQAATFNVSKWSDGDDTTYYSNGGYAPEGGQSQSIEFDCSIINCYITNLTIVGRSSQATGTVKFRNATTGVWFTYLVIDPFVNNNRYAIHYINISTGEGTGTGMGVSGVNLSFSVNSDVQMTEIGVINGTNESTVDTTKPVINGAVNISAPKINDVINFTANVTDDTDLFSVNWTVNLSTGTLYFNYSETGVSVEVSNKTTLTGVVGEDVINFTVFATDANNNVEQDSTLVTVEETTPPLGNSSVNNTAPRLNDVINITVNASDNLGLSTINITINFTTGIVYHNYSVSGTSVSIHNATTITDSRGNVLNITAWITDGVGLVFQNSTKITIANTPPSAPIIILPIANDYNTTTTDYPFNITFPADADGDAVTEIRWYINGALNHTTTGNTTFNATDGYYILDVSLFDNFGYGSNTTVNFTLDTTLAVLDSFNLTNNSLFSFVNTTIFSRVTDTNIYNFTFNLYNRSLDSLQSGFNASNNGGTNIQLEFTLNLTGLASGNYSLAINYSDTHTDEYIEEYDVTELATGFRFKTTENNDITIEELDRVGLIRKIVYSIFNNPNIETKKRFDRYAIEFGREDKKQTRVYRVRADKKIDIINSGYKGHLVVFNGLNGNWIDFENEDKESTINIARVNDYEVIVTVHSYSFNFNSIGGLNVVNTFYNMVVDNDLPYFPFQSFNNTLPNTNDDVDISFTCSDTVGLSTCIIAHNQSGTWVNVTNTTLSADFLQSINYTYTLDTTAADGETIGAMTCANDTSNMFSCSNIFSFQVNDDTNPVINGTLNKSITRIFVNDTINATFNVTDDHLLAFGQVIIFNGNERRFYNFTLSGTSDTFSQNFSIRDNPGIQYNVTGWVNDSFGNYKQNETLFTITRDMIVNVRNVHGNSTINNFSVKIFNSTFAENKSTINGSVDFNDIHTGLYSFNLTSDESGGYFNKTYINQNATNNLVGDLYQTIVYVTAVRRGTNISLSDFNASTPLAVNQSNSTGEMVLLLNATSHRISGFASNFSFDIIQNFSFSNVSENRIELEFYDMNISISIYSAINNTFLKNFTISLKGNNSPFSENLTADNQGNVTFSLTNNSYNITIDAPSHALLTTSFFESGASIFPNLTFSLIGLNSLNFSIYDEFLNKLIVFNTSIYVIGNTFAINQSTQTGNLYFQDLPAQEYRIRYQSDGFTERDHYVNVQNGSNNTIQLYLLGAGNSTDTTFTVQDENVKNLENATVKMLRYFSETNSYKIVAMSRTDSNGQSRIDVEQFNAFYYFIVSSGGVDILTTNPSRVIQTEITLTGLVGEDILKSRQNLHGISHELTFTNSSQQVRFIYSDTKNILKEACLIVTRITPQNTVEEYNTCQISSSGTIIYTANTSQSGTWKAVGRIETTTKSSPYVLEVITFFSEKSKTAFSKFGNMGLYLTSYFIMGLALLAAPVAWLSVLLATVGVIFAAMVGILGLGYTSLAAIVVLAALIMMRIRST